jgi:hypothetical protein
MPGSAADRTSTDFVVIHPLDPEDATITAAMRAGLMCGWGCHMGFLEASES